MAFERDGALAGSRLVRQPCDSPQATEARFVRLGDDGYGQLRTGDLCVSVPAGSRALRESLVFEQCSTNAEALWVPVDWRWNQGEVILKNRLNGLCVSFGDGDELVQDLCNPFDDRSQLWQGSFADGLMARDRDFPTVPAAYQGQQQFASFHEGSYTMDSWTYGDIAFYAPPGQVSTEMAQKWMAWYAHMDALHRRVWNQDNFESVYRTNDANHGSKKVVAHIEKGLCSCGNKRQAEILGFNPRIIADPDNWMHHWVMFYEMNRGGPTPNFYARATWPNTHQGGLILPHMMAALAFYELGGPAGLERDVPGDFLRKLSAWEYDEAKPSLASQEIPADTQMGILILILQERGTDVFIDTLHKMSEKPDATNATQALCDFRDAVNESTGGAYDGRMTNDWRLPTNC